jgi:cytochrome c553
LKAKIMKLFKLTIAVLAIAPLFAAAVSAESHRNCRKHPGGEWRIDPAAYVDRNCAYCHGETMQGKGVAPRVAGQHRDYIVYQFERFRDKSRNNPFSLKYMSHVAVNVLPDSYCELGAYLSGMPAEAAKDGNNEHLAAGEDIFLHGKPSNNLPACQFCHGPEAQGTGKFPRLGGMPYNYTKRRLEQWAEGYAAVSPHMPGIAGRMTPGEIEGVASYLSFQEAAPSRGEF